MPKKNDEVGSKLQIEMMICLEKSKYKKSQKQVFEEVVGFDYDKFIEFQLNDKRNLLELDKKELQKILSEL
jgi:hypothetical protein